MPSFKCSGLGLCYKLKNSARANQKGCGKLPGITDWFQKLQLKDLSVSLRSTTFLKVTWQMFTVMSLLKDFWEE